jgi:phage virion morphogenesis protein
MSAEIAISIVGDDVEGALRRLLGQMQDMTPAMRAISATLADSIEESFDQEADPETGEVWQPLSDVTVALRIKQGTWPGKMLQISQGGLAASFAPSWSNRHAVAASNKPYAAIQHFGGMAGKNRKVKIPARPYAGLTADHRDEVVDIIKRHLSL